MIYDDGFLASCHTDVDSHHNVIKIQNFEWMMPMYILTQTVVMHSIFRQSLTLNFHSTTGRRRICVQGSIIEGVRETVYLFNCPDEKLKFVRQRKLNASVACKFIIVYYAIRQQMYMNKKDGYRQLNVRQLGSLRPWDHHSKCYMDRKRIQCLSNAAQHVPIYLQPFLKYSIADPGGWVGGPH